MTTLAKACSISFYDVIQSFLYVLTYGSSSSSVRKVLSTISDINWWIFSESNGAFMYLLVVAAMVKVSTSYFNEKKKSRGRSRHTHPTSLMAPSSSSSSNSGAALTFHIRFLGFFESKFIDSLATPPCFGCPRLHVPTMEGKASNLNINWNRCFASSASYQFAEAL